jgi:hypothetical protein
LVFVVGSMRLLVAGAATAGDGLHVKEPRMARLFGRSGPPMANPGVAAAQPAAL